MQESQFASAETPDQPSLSPAVLRCCSAWHHRYAAESENEMLAEEEVADLAASSFRRAMPHLTSRRNIQDFIACVAQGMLLGAIEPEDGSRLLYAAQVALAAFREPQPNGRPPKETPPTPIPPNCTENGANNITKVL
jgi:hypothetical protein